MPRFTVTRTTGNIRARRLYSLDGVSCERCGKNPATNRHHIDEEPRNNARSNVRLLCDGCHKHEHAEARRLLGAVEAVPWIGWEEWRRLRDLLG